MKSPNIQKPHPLSDEANKPNFGYYGATEEQAADTQEAGEWPRAWLWPDHVIGKRESRTLRDEHNALVNINAELLGCLRELMAGHDDYPAVKNLPELPRWTRARSIIAKAGDKTDCV